MPSGEITGDRLDLLRSRLRHVRISGDRLRLDRFPDFLIVGPQRTGSTWLYTNLLRHPQIELSCPKELYYFSGLEDAGAGRFGSADLQCYLDCFGPVPERSEIQRGEATASYAVVDPDVIQDICTLNPAIRVILGVRHPVDRAWSHAKKDLARRFERSIDDVAPSAIEAFLRLPYQLRCADYRTSIANWTARLRPGHLLVVRHADLLTRPAALLLEAMGFLGVRVDTQLLGPEVSEVINPTEPTPMPRDVRDYAHRLLQDEIRAFEEDHLPPS